MRYRAVQIGPRASASLGDVRSMGENDTVFIREGAQQRSDWGRYLDAIAAAVSRGADVKWVR